MAPRAEAVLPGRLGSYGADLPTLWYLWKPNLLKAKYLSKELARCQNQMPRSAPFFVADLSQDPWPLPAAERKAAIGRRRQAVKRRSRLKTNPPR